MPAGGLSPTLASTRGRAGRPLRHARIFRQRTAQRHVQRLRMRRQPMRVRCEKGEWRLGVIPILGEVEVNAADEIPCGILALEEFLERDLRLGQFRC